MILLKILVILEVVSTSNGITAGSAERFTNTNPCFVIWTCTGKRLFSFLSNSPTLSKDGALTVNRATEQFNLNQLALGVVTPSMIPTPNYGGTTLVLRYDRKSTMTAYVVKATNNSIFRKYEKYRISADIVAVIHAWFLEPVAVRHAMPRLDM